MVVEAVVELDMESQFAKPFDLNRIFEPGANLGNLQGRPERQNELFLHTTSSPFTKDSCGIVPRPRLSVLEIHRVVGNLLVTDF